ncbi:MAG: pcaK [Alphaproteobacteria bacterium]|nr:pcaK [Alphaproteobacteria bacterium]
MATPGAGGAPAFDAGAVITRTRIGAYQIRILILCFLAAVVEGFDQQLPAIAGPRMLRALGEPIDRIGPLYSAGLLGFVLGGLLLGPLGDRIGRKWLLVGSLLGFGAGTLTIPWLDSFNDILIARLLSGFAFGGASISFVAMPAEYVPLHLRGRVVALIWAGIPVGGTIGSLSGKAFIEAYDWQSLFWIGGGFPFLLAIVLACWLPESIGYLIVRGRDPARIARILKRIAPAAPVNSQTRFIGHADSAERVPIGMLFAEGRAKGTYLIWTALFLAYLIINLMVAWTPALLQQAGTTMGTAALGLAAFNACGLIGILLYSLLVDRRGAPALIASGFVIGAATVLLYALLPVTIFGGFVAIALIGISIGGAGTALIAVAASFYPTAIRSTGVGWSLAFARIGSICGPLLGSLFFMVGMNLRMIFLTIAVPALLTAGAMLLFGRAARALAADRARGAVE